MTSWLLAKLVSLLARHFFARRVASQLLLSVITRAFSIPVFLLGVYFVLQVRASRDWLLPFSEERV